ncbi:MAG: cation:proton antiporter [Bryobacterales bacterium]|nr:cation:proton antiporter [Bryobacterales bacterium]
MHEELFSLGLLIAGAKLAEGITRRLRLSSILAYTLTGLLLGPVSGIIDHTEDLRLLLGIGIFLLFFLIGLDEIDLASFFAAIRGRYFAASSLSVLTSLLFALVVTSGTPFDFGLGLEFREALALAGILSLSSLGLVAKVLSDEGRMRDPVGIEIFITVLIAELLALLLVGIAIGEDTNRLSWVGVIVVLGKIAGFTVVSWLASSRAIPPLIVLLQRFLQVPQLSFGLVLAGLFIIVAAAEVMGIHGSLGALLFGTAMSRLPYQVRRELVPGMRSVADGLFVPLFFASAGLQLSLSFLDLPTLTIAAVVVIPLLGKFIGALIGTYAAGLDRPVTLAAGLMAKGVAEIALLLVLLESGAIARDIFSLLVVVMFAYIVFAPPLISLVVNRTKPSDQGTVPDSVPPSLIRFALDDITVDNILDRTRTHPHPELSVRAFADRCVVPGQNDYVIASAGKFVGIVSLSMLRYLPRTEWARTRLDSVVRRAALRAAPQELVEDVLHRMQEHSLTAIPVIEPEDGQFLGSVTSQEILELITAEARGES